LSIGLFLYQTRLTRSSNSVRQQNDASRSYTNKALGCEAVRLSQLNSKTDIFHVETSTVSIVPKLQIMAEYDLNICMDTVERELTIARIIVSKLTC
jgi:hypothetical protein